MLKKNLALSILSMAILLITCATCWAQITDIEIINSYKENKASLAPHINGFNIDDSPQAAKLLSMEWSFIGKWAANYLSTHHVAALSEVEAAFKKLDPDLNVEIIALDQNTYLVATSQGEVGNVFIVAAQADKFQVVWNIAQFAKSPSSKASSLVGWTAEGARFSCHIGPQRMAWAKCGSFWGAIGKLPDDAAGNHRFYINATHSQKAGSTVGAQLSIWTWKNMRAVPLLVNSYTYMVDQKERLRLDGEFLRIRVKDEFKTFYDCGSCEGRQMDWTIRVSPECIEDLGKKSLVPELDLIDETYYRVKHRLAIDDFASTHAVTGIKNSVNDIWKERAGKKDFLFLGMLAESRVEQERNGIKICFSTDDIGPYWFHIIQKEHGLYISDIEKLSDKECLKK